ncbi:MAG: glutathione S-transferase [Alphaproteobacteria bacterium]|nr:glutathione S-transferase [Alphaproteobacteria bacterium]
MIDLYTSSTPNGRKISIALEEMGLAYEVHRIDLGKGEQFAPAFLALSPNGKIPAIFDRDQDLSVFESGAILMHLGEKTGQLYPAEYRRRIAIHEWLMWQMSSIGPMLGRAHYFMRYNKGKSEFAEAWFATEARRLYGVLDGRLTDRAFICDDYSIVDIATFPWITHHEWHGIALDGFPHVKRWYVEIAARPAVQRGYRVPDPKLVIPAA